jgi:hypothetical protein
VVTVFQPIPKVRLHLPGLFAYHPGTSWRTCGYPGLLSEFLCRIEASVVHYLTQLNPRLRIRGNAVYNDGVGWFWGMPFVPAPDVHSFEVPSSFESLIASWIRDEVSIQDVVGHLLVRLSQNRRLSKCKGGNRLCCFQ